ncbi:hypothetical protein CCP3SC15_150023 [Gammaproteobacteria bacterium]
MPSETLATYNTNPSSADYIVQGINSYFARQREDQLLAREEQTKMAGLFANSKMLRRAKSGETADFNIGKIPWVVDNEEFQGTIVQLPNGIKVQVKTPEDYKSLKEAGVVGRTTSDDVFKEVMASLKLDMTKWPNLSVSDKTLIAAAISKQSNGGRLEPDDLAGLSPEGQSAWGAVASAQAAKPKPLSGWTVKSKGSLAKAWPTATPEILSTTAFDVKKRKSMEDMKNRFKDKPGLRGAASLVPEGAGMLGAGIKNFGKFVGNLPFSAFNAGIDVGAGITGTNPPNVYAPWDPRNPANQPQQQLQEPDPRNQPWPWGYGNGQQ